MSQDAGIDIDYDDPHAIDRELARIQAESAGLIVSEPEPGPAVVAGQVVEKHDTVTFMGEKFRIADKIGLMPMLKFSAHAEVSTADSRALGAMYAMLRDCIHQGTPACGECEACKTGNPDRCPSFDPGDWKRFEDHAMETKADAEDLLDVITDTIELISGRPTAPPSRSSSGRRSISGGSTGRSSKRRAKGSKG